MHRKECVLWFLLVVAIVRAPSSLAAEKRKSAQIDDELFPIYECDDRSRAWTKRCLVPLTNAQLSLDLCGTVVSLRLQKTDLAFVKRCAKELQILAKSCPQPGPVSTLAQDMLDHNPAPPRTARPSARGSAYESQNTPKVPRVAKQSARDSKRDNTLL